MNLSLATKTSARRPARRYGGASRGDPEPDPVATEDIPPEITPRLPARRRRVVPAKATDDELVAIILDATDDPASLTNYKVNKAIKAACGDKGVGETRATRLVDLAQRRHRSRSVVAIGDRR